MLERHRTLREGIIAGAIGATAVAIWFLILDAVGGHPLYTPGMLGASLASLFGGGTMTSTGAVIGYTIFHYAAFMLTGLVIAAIVNNAEEEPSLLIGFLILFVAFEVGWYGWTAVLARSENFGRLAWYQVMVANLIAAVAMGAYMWRAHPALARRLAGSMVQDEG